LATGTVMNANKQNFLFSHLFSFRLHRARIRCAVYNTSLQVWKAFPHHV
jgi:hypothetical protein